MLSTSGARQTGCGRGRRSEGGEGGIGGWWWGGWVGLVGGGVGRWGWWVGWGACVCSNHTHCPVLRHVSDAAEPPTLHSRAPTCFGRWPARSQSANRRTVRHTTHAAAHNTTGSATVSKNATTCNFAVRVSAQPAKLRYVNVVGCEALCVCLTQSLSLSFFSLSSLSHTLSLSHHWIGPRKGRRGEVKEQKSRALLTARMASSS